MVKVINYKRRIKQRGDDGYGYLTYDYMKQYCLDAWSATDLIENPMALVRKIEEVLVRYA
jgi:hypothetical protein